MGTIAKVAASLCVGGALFVAAGCSEADFGGGCVRNAYGAEFCGQEAVNYCEEYGGPACVDLGLPAKGRLERESDAEMEKLERETDQAEQEAEADQAEAEAEQEELERELERDQRKLERDLEQDGF